MGIKNCWSSLFEFITALAAISNSWTYSAINESSFICSRPSKFHVIATFFFVGVVEFNWELIFLCIAHRQIENWRFFPLPQTFLFIHIHWGIVVERKRRSDFWVLIVRQQLLRRVHKCGKISFHLIELSSMPSRLHGWWAHQLNKEQSKLYPWTIISLSKSDM